jgi:membrane associated rhomboid family serine protease
VSPDAADTAETLHCYRHPQRETLLSCSSCERPICTSCMTEAAVGIRCPECAGGRRGLRRIAEGPTTVAARTSTAATAVLIAINVVVFIGELAQGVGFRGVGGSRLVRDFALRGHEVADGEWWRLVTSAFLHASFLHIAFNMYALWLIGGALERYLGPARMLAIYFSAVLWGSAGALIFSPNSLTVGASGGVFGLMAAMLVVERQQGVAFLGSSVGGLLVINLVITFLLPGISVGGHIGGILGGAAAALVLSWFGRGHVAYGRLRAPVAMALVALGAGAVVVALAAV